MNFFVGYILSNEKKTPRVVEGFLGDDISYPVIPGISGIIISNHKDPLT